MVGLSRFVTLPYARRDRHKRYFRRTNPGSVHKISCARQLPTHCRVPDSASAFTLHCRRGGLFRWCLLISSHSMYKHLVNLEHLLKPRSADQTASEKAGDHAIGQPAIPVHACLAGVQLLG